MQDEVELVSNPRADETHATFEWRPYTSQDARYDISLAGKGMDTGIPEFTEHGLLWRPGKLYVFAGRQGDGKTTVMLHLLMRHVQMRDRGEIDCHGRGPAVFLSYEENTHDIYRRLLLWQMMDTLGRVNLVPDRSVVDAWMHNEAGASQDGVMQPISADDSRHIEDAALKLDDYATRNLLVIQDAEAAGGAIDRLISNFETVDPPSLLVVDYFQKIDPPASLGGGGKRQEELQGVSSELLRFCKGRTNGTSDLSRAVPLLVGSQCNRRSASAGAKPMQPELHDLRESDDIANDAAGVVTVFRPGGKFVCAGACGNKASCKCEEPTWQAPPETGVLSMKIVKNRDGRRDQYVRYEFSGPVNYLAPVSRTSILRGVA